MVRRKFPKSLLFLIIFIAVVNTLAVMFSWYWRIKWLDMPAHFLSGLWVGLVALWFFLKDINTRYLYVFFISIGAVLVIGSLWEIFNFSVDAVLSISGQNGALDTVSDIMFDILGGVTASVYFILKNKFLTK